MTLAWLFWKVGSTCCLHFFYIYTSTYASQTYVFLILIDRKIVYNLFSTNLALISVSTGCFKMSVELFKIINL